MKRFNLCVVVVMTVVLTAGFALAGTLDEIQVFDIPLTAGNVEAIYGALEN